VFLVPEKGERYQFAVTAGGVKFDKYTGPKKDLRYQYAKDCTVGAKIGEAHWVCEMKLPFKALRIDPQMGRTWRINLTRFRPGDKVPKASWAETSGEWKNENSYGTLQGLIIGEKYLVEKPSVRLHGVHWSGFAVGRNTVTLKVRGRRSSDACIINVDSLSPSGKKIKKSRKVQIVERGATEHVAEYELAPEAGEHRITVSLADARDGKVFYRSPPTVAEIPSFLTAFCDRNYYTSEKNCRIIVQFADAIRGRLAGKTLKVVLRDSGGKSVAEATREKLRTREVVPLPFGTLATGVHAAEVALLDGTRGLSRCSFAVEKYPPRGKRSQDRPGTRGLSGRRETVLCAEPALHLGGHGRVAGACGRAWI